jgi:hypothetical protein
VIAVTGVNAHAVDPRDMGVRLRTNSDLVASAVSAVALISRAYGAPADGSLRLSRLPGWTLREQYDIEAKAQAMDACVEQ